MVNVTVKSYRPLREKEIIDKVYSNMDKVGNLVERQAKINVSKSPPEHPRVDTGRLRASILHWTYLENNVIGTSIGTNVKYGRHLEFGTVNHSPYPWLFPAVEQSRNAIKEALLSKTFAAGLQTTVGEYGVSEEVQTTDVKEL